MQEQFKYIVDGKVVDRKDFNKLFKNKYIHIEGDKVYAVDFSSVSNLFDGDFKSSRQINDHVKDILDLGQIRGNSTRHKSQNGEAHKEIIGDLEGINKPPKTEQLNYQSFYQVVYTKPTSNWSKFEITFSDEDLEKIQDLSIGDIKEMFNSTISTEQNKTKENLVFQKDSEIHKEEGIKETNGKTDYSEIDWDFIEGLAKRMNKNKEKYEPFNYHKPMDVNLLKQSLLRHIIEILKGEHNDAGQEYGHLFAVSLNSMMIYYQLKNNS